jgi:hypothetical protein
MRLGFNPREYANRSPKSGRGTKYKPMPEGFYNVECIEITIAKSKAGDKMIKAEFEILDAPDDAGHVWDYFLQEHANPDVLDIARERFAHWAVSAGKPDCQDTSELEHTKARVKLVIEPGRGDFGPSNKIKFYVVPKGKAAAAQLAAELELKSKPRPELDDEIPF